MAINEKPALIKQHRIIGILFPLSCLLTLCLLKLFIANQSAALDVPQAFFDKAVVAAPGPFTSASEHTSDKKSQILILDGSPEGLPQPAAMIRAIMDTLKKNDFSVNNLFIEHLDLARYPDFEHRAILQQLLRYKFACQSIGMIICINQQAFEFLSTDIKDLLPDVPALLVNVQRPDVCEDDNPRKSIELFSQEDIAGTLRYASTLFPEKRRLLVINGHDDSNVPFLEAVAEAIDRLPTKLEVEYTGLLSYEEMLQRIAMLPPNTIAFLGPYFNDRTGRKFVPAEVAAVVAKTANVPVFADVDALIFQGLFGGSTVLTDMTGKRTAEIALDYLNGNISLTQQKIRFEMGNVPLFNWPQIVRWKIRTDKLPANAILINRPPTLWGQYKTAVISAMLVIIILIAFIVALIIENRRRKISEKMARESEESFRSLFEDHAAVKLIIDPVTGNIINANHAAAAFYGWPRETLTRMSIQEINLLPPEAVKEEMEKAIAATRDHFEFQHRLADGSIRTVSVFSSSVKMGGRMYLHSIIHDITARKQAEEDRLRLAAAIEQSGEMVVMTDREGIIQYVNPAFEQITGYTCEEAVGKNPRILKGGKQGVDFYKGLWNTLTVGGTWKGHFVNKKKDGVFFEEDATISPVRNLSGEITHYVAVKRDVTEQLKMERQLHQAQKMDAIGTLAGGIAHDFNNILGAISGYTEISLGKIPPDSRIKYYLEQIQASSRRAINLVQQILDFSRLTEKERKPVSLTPLIKETIKMLREIIPSTIEIRLNAQTDDDTILGDATQIYQILMNLCTNAYQAMKDKGGLLEVELVRREVREGGDIDNDLQGFDAGSYIELTVKDTGNGIDPIIQKRIFDPFFTTKKVGEGTGLGLSVVHGIVRSYGGKISVESRIGKGSSFHVYLPILVEKPETPAKVEEPLDMHGKGRILLVDDEAMLANVMKEMLEDRGYTVIARTDSIVALETFRDDPDRFDLVITDQTMPEMTGIDLAGQVMAIRPEIPVILCTGFIDSVIEEKATKTGIRGFLLKPVNMKRLITLICDLLAPAG